MTPKHDNPGEPSLRDVAGIIRSARQRGVLGSFGETLGELPADDMQAIILFNQAWQASVGESICPVCGSAINRPSMCCFTCKAQYVNVDGMYFAEPLNDRPPNKPVPPEALERYRQMIDYYAPVVQQQ